MNDLIPKPVQALFAPAGRREERLAKARGQVEVTENPAACAADVQTVASGDLARMGLSLVGFTLRNPRAA